MSFPWVWLTVHGRFQSLNPNEVSMTMKGFIYVLSNPSLPSLKIGKTKADPSQRVKELTGSTSIPTPFVIEYYAYVEEFDAKEREIHQVLDDARVNKNREFFEVDIASAIGTIEATCNVLYSEKLTDKARETSDDDIQRVSDATATLIETKNQLEVAEEIEKQAVKVARLKAQKAGAEAAEKVFKEHRSNRSKNRSEAPIRTFIHNALTWPAIGFWFLMVGITLFGEEGSWLSAAITGFILIIPVGLWVGLVSKVLGVDPDK